MLDIGKVALHDEEEPAVDDGQFRVRTLYSGVSAGTELSFVKGTNPYVRARWDPHLAAFVDDRPDLAYPVTSLGYMEAAVVVDSRTDAVEPGARDGVRAPDGLHGDARA